MNMTQREAVLTLYLAAGALGMVAIFVTQASILEGYIAGGIVVLAALYALWHFERHWHKNEESTNQS
jgi:UDP-GlcNAc:undecaprenyl-phosphate GlcNAc-1-phosphate transferase